MGADRFVFDKDHLQNLKTQVNTLSTDLTGDVGIAELQEWGSTTLWDPSSWNSKTAGAGGDGGDGTATMMLLPGNTDLFSAAKTLQARGGVYASAAINAVNWVHDVLTNLSSNIDFTITKIDGAEADNSVTVDQAIQDFTQTIGDLGGSPSKTPDPSTLSL